MEETKKLKRIDFESGSFEANGKVYTIEGELSISRYAEFQILEKELAYGFTVREIFDKLKTIWENGNKSKHNENAVLLNDLLQGVSKLHERQPIVLKICTLFINTPDEERTTISSDLMEAKITDWKKEGIAMQDFFGVASNSVNGLIEIYQNITRNTSDQTENERAANR